MTAPTEDGRMTETWPIEPGRAEEGDPTDRVSALRTMNRRTVLKGTAAVLALGASTGPAGATRPAQLIINLGPTRLPDPGRDFTVTGTVSAEEPESIELPVEGARVLAALESRPPDFDRDVTDENGDFAVTLTAPDVVRGEFTLRIGAAKEGYLPTEETVSIEVVR